MNDPEPPEPGPLVTICKPHYYDPTWQPCALCQRRTANRIHCDYTPRVVLELPMCDDCKMDLDEDDDKAKTTARPVP